MKKFFSSMFLTLLTFFLGVMLLCIAFAAYGTLANIGQIFCQPVAMSAVNTDGIDTGVIHGCKNLVTGVTVWEAGK